MSDEQGYSAGSSGPGWELSLSSWIAPAERLVAAEERSKALAEALRELLDAGEECVSPRDEVAAACRFGDAINAARAALEQSK